MIKTYPQVVMGDFNTMRFGGMPVMPSQLAQFNQFLDDQQIEGVPKSGVAFTEQLSRRVGEH